MVGNFNNFSNLLGYISGPVSYESVVPRGYVQDLSDSIVSPSAVALAAGFPKQIRGEIVFCHQVITTSLHTY